MNEIEPISERVLGDIKKHFRFLFDKGYVVHSASTINKDYGVWEVILKHQDFLVRLFAERGGLDLFFGSSSAGFVEMRSLIYFLSGERDFYGLHSFGDMRADANLLQEHIEEFESCFGSDFPKYEEGLKSAEQRYYARLSPETVDAQNVVFTEPRQRSRRSLILLAIILFPIYLLFFAIIISLAVSSLSLGFNNDAFYSIMTWGASFFLAVWVAVAIIRSSKSG